MALSPVVHADCQNSWRRTRTVWRHDTSDALRILGSSSCCSQLCLRIASMTAASYQKVIENTYSKLLPELLRLSSANLASTVLIVFKTPALCFVHLQRRPRVLTRFLRHPSVLVRRLITEPFFVNLANCRDLATSLQCRFLCPFFVEPAAYSTLVYQCQGPFPDFRKTGISVRVHGTGKGVNSHSTTVRLVRL